MKSLLLKQIWCMTKCAFYGIFIQCLLCGILIASDGNSQNVKLKDVKISIQLDNVHLTEAFSQVAEKTGFNFIYNRKLVKNRRISLVPKEQSMMDLLLNFSEKFNIKFNRINENIYVSKIEKRYENTIPVIEKFSNDIVVTGRVTDENGEPLVGASVVIKGTSKGTITDVEGKYTINVPDDAVLVVSFLGYADQEVMVSGRSIVDVKMVVDVESLDEVVVVGYGVKAEKRDLTGSISSVGAKDLAYTQNHSVDQKLSGMMAGVQVLSSGGRPGAGAKINIRGVTALRGSNQPLYVVDGTPVVVAPNFGTDQYSIATKLGVRENPLLGINPDDIERIDVLKDASATALYGARAANGVILITTKRGKENTHPEFNFSITTAIQNPTNKYQPLDANQYRIYLKRLKPDIKDDYFGNANTNWQDLILNKNALMTKYNMSVSGGAERMNYYLSGSATNHQGVLKGNRFKRYNLRASITSEVANRLTIGTSINYNYSINRSSPNIRNLLDGLNFRPDYSIYDKNGNYSVAFDKEGSYLKRNPVGSQENSWEKTKLNNLLGDVYVEYEIIENLKFKSSVNIGIYNSATVTFHPKHSGSAQSGKGTVKNPLSELVHNNAKSHNTTFVNTLRYNSSWGDHDIDGLLGVSWEKYRMDLIQSTYRGFIDDIRLIDPKSSQFVTPVRSQTTLNGLNSMFARVNYTYRGRYLLTFTARRDGSTKFGPKNRYGFFPSGGIAWNMDREKFMSGIRQVSYLKLRGSIGKTGSDNLPSFSYANNVSTLSGSHSSEYAGTTGIVPLARPNPNIRWEETLQTDVGIEFGLFNHRLNAEVVYFNKNTSGIIVARRIPFQYGFESLKINFGDIRNWGWEFTIGGDIVRNKHFRWNSSINISFVKNLLVQVGNGGGGARTSIREGEPIGYIWGDPILRIAQTQKEIDELDRKAPSGKYDKHLNQPGDYIRKDINGDGEINDGDDAIALGNMFPDYYGGWTNRLSYKNFDFSFHFQFSQGAEKYWKLQAQLLDGKNIFKQSNTTTIALNAWSPDNRNAYYARPGSPELNETNSRNVFDASFIRLRSISMGYTFPQQWTDKTPFSTIQLSLGANNLLTITKYPGLDPENGTKGFQGEGDQSDHSDDLGQEYPMTRTFSANINITF